MKYEEIQEMQCPICGKKIKYDESFRGAKYLDDLCVAEMTSDCHGIPFRVVCIECYEEIMESKGFDGVYYTEADECIDYDY